MTRSKTEMQTNIEAISTMEEVRSGLNTIIEKWPTNIHQAGTMQRWIDAEKLYSSARDDEGYIRTGKKFLGRCLHQAEDYAARWPLAVEVDNAR